MSETPMRVEETVDGGRNCELRKGRSLDAVNFLEGGNLGGVGSMGMRFGVFQGLQVHHVTLYLT